MQIKAIKMDQFTAELHSGFHIGNPIFIQPRIFLRSVKVSADDNIRAALFVG
jgi:hypothetical protein